MSVRPMDDRCSRTFQTMAWPRAMLAGRAVLSGSRCDGAHGFAESALMPARREAARGEHREGAAWGTVRCANSHPSYSAEHVRVCESGRRGI